MNIDKSNLKRYFQHTGLLLVAFLTFGYSEDPTFNTFFGVDAGRIEKGIHHEAGSPDISLKGLTLVRNYFNLSYTEQLDEKNLISIGIGGLFWKPYQKGGDATGDKTLKFGPGMSHVTMSYTMNEDMNINYGFMEYKYNKSAKNL